MLDRAVVALFLAVPAEAAGVNVDLHVELRQSCAIIARLSVKLSTKSALAGSEFRRWQEYSYLSRRDRLLNLPFDELLYTAAHLKEQCCINLIAVTGSVGKTSTKEAIGDALSDQGCYMMPDSWNAPTEICAQMALNHNWARWFVAEVAVGIHVSEFAHHVVPDILVFTELGPAHLEKFKTVDEIGRIKASLAKGMKSGAKLIINGDQPTILACIAETIGNDRLKQFSVKTFGTTSHADIRIMRSKCSVAFYTKDCATCLDSNWPTSNSVHPYAAAAAALVGDCIGVRVTDALRRIANAGPPSGGCHRREGLESNRADRRHGTRNCVDR